jgi:hypothetical protein
MGIYELAIYGMFALSAVGIAATILLIVWVHHKEAKLIDKRGKK